MAAFCETTNQRGLLVELLERYSVPTCNVNFNSFSLVPYVDILYPDPDDHTIEVTWPNNLYYGPDSAFGFTLISDEIVSDHPYDMKNQDAGLGCRVSFNILPHRHTGFRPALYTKHGLQLENGDLMLDHLQALRGPINKSVWQQIKWETLLADLVYQYTTAANLASFNISHGQLTESYRKWLRSINADIFPDFLVSYKYPDLNQVLKNNPHSRELQSIKRLLYRFESLRLYFDPEHDVTSPALTIVLNT